MYFHTHVSRDRNLNIRLFLTDIIKHRCSYIVLEFAFLTNFIGLSFHCDSEECTFGLMLGFISCWLKFEGLFPKWFVNWWNKKYQYNQKELSLTYILGSDDNFLSWKLWTDAHNWSSKTPKWRDGNFSFVDFLFGERKYKENVINYYKDILIPMPERSYLANIQEREDAWKRPRSPFTLRVKRYNFDMIEPIPHPGKWGDDATYGLTCPADSLSDAIGKMVSSVMRSRLKYGYHENDYVWKKEAPKARFECNDVGGEANIND